MKKDLGLGKLLAGIVALGLLLVVGIFALVRFSTPDTSAKASSSGTVKPGGVRSNAAPDASGQRLPTQTPGSPGGKGTSPGTGTSVTSAAQPGADEPKGPSRAKAVPDQIAAELTEIGQLPGTLDRRMKLLELGAKLASEGFRSALALAKAVEDRQIRRTLLEGIFHYQASYDPQSAMAATLEYKPANGNSRHKTRAFYDQDASYRTVLGFALRGWASTDATGALEQINALPSAYRGQAINAVYAGWAETAPAEAIEHAQAQSVEFRNRVMGSVIGTWSEHQPEAAATYIASAEGIDPQHQEALLKVALRKWAEADVNPALAWANNNITDDDYFESVVVDVAQDLSTRTPEKAAEVVAMIPELAATQAGLTYRIVDSWSVQDPRRAAEWGLGLQDPGQRKQSIKIIAANWAKNSLDDARTWAETLPEENNRAYALSKVAAQQGQYMTERSTDWIRKLPADFVQAQAAAGYALGKLRSANDYRGASLVQKRIGDDAVDLDGIATVVQDSMISDSDKEALLRLLR